MRLALLQSLLFACDGGFADPSRELGPPVEGAADGEVRVHHPAGLGVVDTPLRDVHGAPIGVACQTCHAPGAEGVALVDGVAGPSPMHDSVELRHGSLRCGSCHDAQDRGKLRLADGATLDMADAMQLCAQCHGGTHQDYLHGAHGGMSGAWDLRRGDRVRNHCLDCHPAHAPGWEPVLAVFPPADRGTLSMSASPSPAGAHP